MMYQTSTACLHHILVYGSMSSTPHPQKYGGVGGEGERERKKLREQSPLETLP